MSSPDFGKMTKCKENAKKINFFDKKGRKAVDKGFYFLYYDNRFQIKIIIFAM